MQLLIGVSLKSDPDEGIKAKSVFFLLERMPQISQWECKKISLSSASKCPYMWCDAVWLTFTGCLLCSLTDIGNINFSYTIGTIFLYPYKDTHEKQPVQWCSISVKSIILSGPLHLLISLSYMCKCKHFISIFDVTPSVHIVKEYCGHRQAQWLGHHVSWKGQPGFHNLWQNYWQICSMKATSTKPYFAATKKVGKKDGDNSWKGVQWRN